MLKVINYETFPFSCSQPLSSLSLPLSPFPSSSLPLHVIYLQFSVGPPPAWDTHGGGCRPP